MATQTDADRYYQAMLARDYRFDGKFFVGVKTTGIYCRPICPAKPKRENVEFFASALSAEKAGYRPCLRCRPECAPLSPAWGGKSGVVRRALRLIASGKLLEMNEDEFAGTLGVSARHLRRLFEEELGKTPKQVSDSNRLDFARKLLAETRIPVTEIAFSSGFSSIRRFNDAVRARFHRTPTEIRKKTVPDTEPDCGIHLALTFRPPFDWKSLLHFFESHAIPGVETVRDGGYERVFEFDGAAGALRVEASPSKPELELRVATSDYKHLFRVTQKLRQMFDLDSDPLLISQCFEGCQVMSSLGAKHPGLRVARGWDPFESAIGSILGQLVSLEQARRLVGQLVSLYGRKVRNPLTGADAHLFPEPRVLARADLAGVGTTSARKAAIREFSRRVSEGALSLEPTQDPEAFRKSLLTIPGIGAWTAEYISLRALGDPDAFPGTDLILKRAMDLHAGLRLEELKPWRAYVATYLWKEYATPLSKKKGKNA